MGWKRLLTVLQDCHPANQSIKSNTKQPTAKPIADAMAAATFTNI